MKLRYIIATIAAALTFAVGCEKEMDHYLDEIKVTSSYLSFPAQGGSTEINYIAIDSWTVNGLPDFISASPASGGQGEGVIKFTATAATETREGTFTIDCAGKSQTISYIQVTEKVEPKLTSIADVIAAGAGTFRVRGTVTKITATTYGNWYLNDGTTDANGGNGLYIYGTLNKKGNTYDKNNAKMENINCPANPDAWEFAPGDILTVEGPYTLYNGTTPEMVDVTVIDIERSLIKVAEVSVTEFPLEGGESTVTLEIKGDGFHVAIPEEAKSWLHISDFGSDYVTLIADPNPGGDRKATVVFTTTKGGETYSCEQEFVQKGAILEVPIADFLAAAVGDTQFRLTGVIVSNYESDKNGQSFTMRDWSGEALVYRLNDYKASGANVGDVITVVGKRGAYRENPQMVEGVYEKHIATVKDKKLAEIAAAADDANVYYIATGTIKEIVNETYGNVWLTDDSGELYVYGCYPGWGASGDNRKNFLATAGIKVGDKLSVIGVKGTHSDAPQISNGIYFSHEAGSAPADEWDYTPGDEYKSAANLWKPVDENHTINWYYNPNWAGELEAPETSFKESTYTVKLNEADDAAEWTTQMKIIPASDFLLDPQKKYTFSCKVHSTTGTNVFIKMYQNGVDWPESFETPASPNRISIAAGETKEIKVENFIPLETPQMILIDFAHHAGDNTIHVKDIVVKETGSITPAGEWDYTPGEDYLAYNNLWRTVATGSESYYYYHCIGADWNGTDTLSDTVPFLTVKESTYELDYADATTSSWQNQLFIYPNESHSIALDAAKTYKLKVTIGSNNVAPAFFKISKYDAANPKHEGEVIYEAGSTKLDPSTPWVIEKEITGVSCDNIILVMDFGGNPADTKIYIKDITLLDLSAPVDNSLSITDILNQEKGAAVESKECQVTALTKVGFVASDGNKAVYVYTKGNEFDGKVGLGDNIKFAGSKTVFNGVHEIEKLTALQIISVNNTISYPAKVTDVTATATSYDATEAEFISFTGTLSISGNYYNVNIDGVDSGTKQGSLVYPADYLGASSYDGKHIRVTGYFNGLSGKGKYLNVVTTSIDAVAEASPSLYLNEFDTKNKKLEIYNATDKEVDIAGWKLVKDGGLEDKDIFVIPASLEASKVPAKGYAVFTCKQSDAANGPLFGLSGTKGFKIELKNGDTVVDVADNLTSITEIPDGKSWGRETDGAEKFVIFDTPTIGSANGVSAVSVKIDGDMSEWAAVEGTVLVPSGEEGKEGAQAIEELKGYADDNFIYVYVKRTKLGRWTQLFNGEKNAGYYYYDFDLDNNAETGEYAENSHGNYEAWTYLYIFGGSADAPVFRETPPGSAKGMSIDNVKCAGVISANAVEVEAAFPRADLPAFTSDTIAVTVWGNKDGNPLTKVTFKVK